MGTLNLPVSSREGKPLCPWGLKEGGGLVLPCREAFVQREQACMTEETSEAEKLEESEPV